MVRILGVLTCLQRVAARPLHLNHHKCSVFTPIPSPFPGTSAVGRGVVHAMILSDLDISTFVTSELREHREAFEDTSKMIEAPFRQALAIWERSIRAGGKILLFGNGGSAGDSQHLATELTIRYSKDRAPIAAIALTTDSSALTACGNDFGFVHVFERQVEALGRKGDVAFGITTSGNSDNVVLALQKARAMGLETIVLTGGTGGKVRDLADVAIIVPSRITARIQEMHIMIGQMLCGALEQRLGLVAP